MKDAFLFKAQENLVVAEWSYANGHFNACANRAYDAAFQAAVAVLAHFGFTYSERVEHQNVQRYFATELSDKRKGGKPMINFKQMELAEMMFNIIKERYPEVIGGCGGKWDLS